MGRSNPQQILNNLASSQNNFAAGLGLCVQALAEATASAPVTPIMIEYRNGRMAFGRRSLARMGGHVGLFVSHCAFKNNILPRKQLLWQLA
jgi:hypothetical protein